MTDALIRYVIDVDAVPADGEVVEIRAIETDRARIAETFDILSLHRLDADLVVKPYRRGGVSVKGNLSADVVQTCVVTLEPVSQAFVEEIDMKFVPPGSRRPRTDAEVDVDPDAADPPDEIEDGRVDIGAIVIEHFALGLDPYPRKEGADLAESATVSDNPLAADQSPFAALSGLKKQ